MKPIKFDDQNVIYKLPGCGDLPARIKDGITLTCWELAPEEIEKIKETGLIWISFIGMKIPPMSVTLEKLNFDESDE